MRVIAHLREGWAIWEELVILPCKHTVTMLASLGHHTPTCSLSLSISLFLYLSLSLSLSLSRSLSPHAFHCPESPCIAYCILLLLYPSARRRHSCPLSCLPLNAPDARPAGGICKSPPTDHRPLLPLLRSLRSHNNTCMYNFGRFACICTSFHAYIQHRL